MSTPKAGEHTVGLSLQQAAGGLRPGCCPTAPLAAGSLRPALAGILTTMSLRTIGRTNGPLQLQRFSERHHQRLARAHRGGFDHAAPDNAKGGTRVPTSQLVFLRWRV